MEEFIVIDQPEPDELEVASFLKGQFEDNACLLGSQLGGRLHARFPGLHIKTRFGGLKKLVETLGAGQIQAARRKGVDWEFERTCSKKPPFLTDRPPESIWRVFRNPSLSGKLVLHPGCMTLKVIASDEEILSEEVEIPRITHEDQRTVMAEFAKGLDGAADWTALIGKSDAEYWRSFMHAVQKLGQQSEWLKFRWQRFADEFIKKLVAANVPPEKARQLANEWIKNDSKAPALPKSPIPSGGPPSAHNLRSLAHLIIDHMSDDELAGIRVSLGSVLASLTNRQ